MSTKKQYKRCQAKDCRNPITQLPTGRSKKFCCANCRVRTFLNNHPGYAKEHNG